MDDASFREALSRATTFQENPYHPFVWISGEPSIGQGTVIGAFSEVYAKGARVMIGARCDIASFVAINCADSHMRCIGASDRIDRRDIEIGDNVFIGSHSFVKGGTIVGHHSVIAAGTIVGPGKIPPYSLVVGNPMVVKPGYYAPKEDDA